MMDELKETFIDINMNSLIDLHESIQNDIIELGYMNNSQSSDFIHTILDNMFFNDYYYDSSSEDEN